MSMKLLMALVLPHVGAFFHAAQLLSGRAAVSFLMHMAA